MEILRSMREQEVGVLSESTGGNLTLNTWQGKPLKEGQEYAERGQGNTKGVEQVAPK